MSERESLFLVRFPHPPLGGARLLRGEVPTVWACQEARLGLSFFLEIDSSSPVCDLIFRIFESSSLSWD